MSSGKKKGLSEVLAIPEEIQNASVHVKQQADHRTHSKASAPSSPSSSRLYVNIIVLSPSFLGVHITSVQVEAPDVVLLGDVLVYQKVLETDTNADFWIG